ncbi:MAG: tRNA-intron lyase [Candidatus Bilamarchaeaceae archaeon]
MIKLHWDKKKIWASDPADITSLQNGFYGYQEIDKRILSIEEALYIMDIRNGRCFDLSDKEHSFSELALAYLKNKKLLARYLTYKDWRDKGLIARPATEAYGSYGRSIAKKYRIDVLKIDDIKVEGVFFIDDLMTVIDDENKGKILYEKYWLGQFGTYKAAHRGRISKLDIYETIFLCKKKILKLKNCSLDGVIKIAKKRIKYFEDIYSVYEDWRNRGYIVKTGFKFGTHFRIYFPGASPVNTAGEWIHSKHVLHVFSRKDKMLISEWARAIRVAHSVKKTFILAIPGKKTEIKVNPKKPRLDFLLYPRKKDGIETPKTGAPQFLMYSLSEDEYIGGEELAKALAECDHYGLEMLMAISDRESSVTYYIIRKIELGSSDYEYYEIEWTQP